MEENDRVDLQVLICTYGEEGIRRVARGSHPALEGVEYLVSWQASDGVDVPQVLASRSDFRICRSDTVGLSKNRNNAFSESSAPLLLISDDDVDYREEWLRNVVAEFASRPEADIIAFRYESEMARKDYPRYEASLSRPPKGYFVTSFELAVRRQSVVGRISFNENFGIGAVFPAGEEDVFVKDCLDAGLDGIYLPVTIVRHEGTTTSERNLMSPDRPRTKGAVFLRLHPCDWPLRMVAHVLREIPLWRKGLVPNPLSYCVNWMRGVCQAWRLGVFKKVDK